MKTFGIEQKRYSLTGAALKTTACLTMLVDHFFAVLFLNYMKLHPVDGGWAPRLEPIYRAGRAVGRLSFVLFAFLIVEGFVHTRSRLRYLLRLGLFALLSEIPFDLAFSGKVIDWNSQNIFCTLFLGVLVLTLWEHLGEYWGVIPWIGRPVILLAGCAAAFFGSTDYRYMGILLIFVMYQTRGRGVAVQILTAGCVMFFGTWSAYCIRYAGRFTVNSLFLSSLREMYGLLAFLLIPFYGGEKGRQLPKFFYYGFYPVHLLVLYGIARVIRVM